MLLLLVFFSNIFSEKRPTSLGPSSTELDGHKVKNSAVVWRVHISYFKLFLHSIAVLSSGPKRKRTTRTVMQAKFKIQHLGWHRGVFVPMKWVTSVSAPLKLKGTYRFWGKIFCHSSNVLFRDSPAYFSKTIPHHILHVLLQCGFIVKECEYEAGLLRVSQWKCVLHYEVQNGATETPDCWTR